MSVTTDTEAVFSLPDGWEAEPDAGDAGDAAFGTGTLSAAGGQGGLKVRTAPAGQGGGGVKIKVRAAGKGEDGKMKVRAKSSDLHAAREHIEKRLTASALSGQWGDPEKHLSRVHKQLSGLIGPAWRRG
jgi:hypothetical protein